MGPLPAPRPGPGLPERGLPERGLPERGLPERGLPERVEWQVAVFCQNEQATIAACLASVAAAIGDRHGLITVLLNGSSDASQAAAEAAAAASATPVRILRLGCGDKAHAINVFLHDRRVRAEAELFVFVDAYVTIAPGALAAMAERLAGCPAAVAATGVPENGRSEARSAHRTIAAGGRLHGQFFALRPDFVRRLTERGLHLPIGLYRGDGLLGSMAAHDLDALGQPWDDGRVVGVAGARFRIAALSPWRWRDVRRQLRRKIRQMRGLVENAAIKRVIYTGNYTALPAFADDLIRDFLAAHPAPAVSWPERPFMARALAEHRAAVRPDAEALRWHPAGKTTCQADVLASRHL